jgi:hypothetical protein
MGFGYVSGATPVVESVSLRFKLFNFVKCAPLKIGAAYPPLNVFD